MNNLIDAILASLLALPAPAPLLAGLAGLAGLAVGVVIGVLAAAARGRLGGDMLGSRRDRLRRIVDQLPFLVAYIDRQERYQFNNRAYVEWFGEEPEAYSGRALRSVLGADVYAAVEPDVRQALAGRTVTYLRRLPYPKAGERDVRVTYAPDRDDDGFVRGYVAIVEDVSQQQLLARQLAEALALNEQILEAAPVGILVYTAGGECVHANGAVAAIVGGTVAEVLRLNFREIESWRVSGLLDVVEQVLADGAPAHFESHFRSTFGREFWLDCRIAPLTVDAAPHVLLIFDDTSARKQAERELAHHRQHLEELVHERTAEMNILLRVIEQSPISITIMDTEGVISYANPRFTQQTGFTLEEVQGKRPRVLSQEPLSEEGRQLWEVLRAQSEWRGELRNTTKSGRTYWEYGIVAPIVDEEGRTSHFVAMMEDTTQLTQQQREQEAMLAAATALRAVYDRDQMLAAILQQVCGSLEATLSFFVAPDPASGEMAVEAAWQQGRYFNALDVRTPPDRGISAHVLHTREPYRTDDVWADPLFAAPTLIAEEHAAACVPLLAPEGAIGVLWVARTAPLADNELRLLSAIADMTAAGLQRAALHEQAQRYAANLEQEVAERTAELRAANQRLQELDQLKSKFVSDVSHELRTPVTNIGLYLDLLDRKPEKRDHYLRVLRDQADRLEQLVTQVLDLARLDNTQKIERERVDLNEVIQAAVTAQEAKAEVQDIVLHFERGADPCSVLGNRSKLMQVATNLLINALNYTRSGQVCVRSGRGPGDTVQFTVEDTGVGIYAEDLPHLFERFYRGRRDQGADAPGAGLGLVIVKEVLDLHGGSISVQSEVGKGSIFTVTLPAAQ